MKAGIYISNNSIFFSHWCGKGYAVFAALGKEVRISALAIHICESALLKSAHTGVIVNCAGSSEHTYEPIDERELYCGYSFIYRGEVCDAGNRAKQYVS